MTTYRRIFSKTLAYSSLIAAGTFAPIAAFDCDCLHETEAAISDWVSDIRFYGDFRFRYEYFDNDDSSNPERHRLRLRSRLGSKVSICEMVTLNMRIASGDSDPASTNQTLENCFSSKGITLDQAFVTITHPEYPYLAAHRGKMTNPDLEPRLLSPMTYDSDVTPEGFAITGDYKWESVALNGYIALYNFDDFVGSSDNAWILDMMLAGDFEIGDVNAMLAAGFYTTKHMDMADCQAFLGNRGQAGAGPTNWLGDFTVLRLFGQFDFSLSEDDFFGTPNALLLTGGYVMNFNSDYDIAGLSDERHGWTVQMQYGEAKQPGAWQLAAQYKYLEADAVVDQLTDSDWGNGGTNRKGWVVAFKYAVCSWWNFGAKAFFTKRVTDRGSGRREIVTNGETLTRIQVDTVMEF